MYHLINIRHIVRRLFLLLVFLFDSFGLKAQSAVTDSLTLLFETAKADTTKAYLLQDLGMSVYLSDPNKAMSYWQQNVAFIDGVIEKADSISFKSLSQTKAYSLGSIAYINQTLGKIDEAIANNNEAYLTMEKLADKSGMAEILNNIGIIYMNRGDLELSKATYIKCTRLFNEAKNYQGLGMASQNLALIYKNQGKIAQAIIFYNLSMRIRDAIKDSVGLGHSYYELAIIYRLQNEPEKAKEYFKRSIEIRRRVSDLEGLGNSLNELGALLLSEKKYNEAKQLFDESIGYLNKINALGGLSFAYSNLGTLSLDLNKPDSAIFYFSKALDLRIQNQDEKGRSLSLYLLGKTWLIKNNLQKSEELGLQSFELANKFGFMETKQKSAELLSTVYERKGDFAKAFQYHKVFKQYSDSLFNKNTQKKALTQQMSFEFDKKQSIEKLEQEKRNAITKEELKQQKQQRNYFIAGFILVILLALFIYRGYRQKQKANLELDAKNILIQHQKEIVLEKQKEIVDSINYAQRIQRALLANETLLSTNLPEHFIFFQPKDIVSGDFYWAAKTVSSSGAENFILCTADSTGHGVPGAIMSMLNISGLVEAVDGQKISEPKDILNYTRDKIIKHLSNDLGSEGGKDGMDCSLISFDLKNRIFTYAAANNPIWVVRDNQLTELKPDKMPVGKHDKDYLSFTQHTFELRPGDCVYTLTDGFPDQFGGLKGKKFLYKTLKELLLSINHMSMHEQQQAIQSAFTNWKGDLEQVDDVLVIGIRV
ncbi:MAG: protein serine/threonine phosphatase [Bacteroidetes bacterium]|jgi:serine phosphatase RsbU (regulator of sigma subunit)/Tfp pilus assembly protein PilF|nr:protein serine/threonine phosphatase [Bacteroidota bacterium]